jgi:hypothetical protein
VYFSSCALPFLATFGESGQLSGLMADLVKELRQTEDGRFLIIKDSGKELQELTAEEVCQWLLDSGTLMNLRFAKENFGG